VAVVGALKGGVGSASAVLSTGATVAALVVLNAAGTAVHQPTGELYGARFGLVGEFDRLRPPDPAELAAALDAGLLRSALDGPLRATTLSLLATDATLSKAQCTLLAGMGARRAGPRGAPGAHHVDGDTTFALSTDVPAGAGAGRATRLLAVGADCVTRAIVHAALAAESVRTPAGWWPAYTAALPSTLLPASR